MTEKRTTYSMSPGCSILFVVLVILIGMLIGVGFEVARELMR